MQFYPEIKQLYDSPPIKKLGEGKGREERNRKERKICTKFRKNNQSNKQGHLGILLSYRGQWKVSFVAICLQYPPQLRLLIFLPAEG